MEEFDFSTEKINDNFSNYSAWHYRSKLLPLTHPDVASVALIDPEKHRQGVTPIILKFQCHLRD
jgi:Protein prenyltransferase alpha subunit repeat